MNEKKTKQLRNFCDYRTAKNGLLRDFVELRKGYRKMKRIFQTLTPAQKKRGDAFMRCAIEAGMFPDEENA